MFDFGLCTGYRHISPHSDNLRNLDHRLFRSGLPHLEILFMSFRNVFKRCPARRSSFGSLRRRRVLVEQLESRQLLAADVGFVNSLPTAVEAQFGDVVLNDEGREVCLAFMAVGTAEGEDPIESLDDPGPVDLSAMIVQPAGPLAPGAAFTSEITFENAGPNDAIETVLGVTFDANLTGVTWEREIIRPQSATVAVADLYGPNGLALQGIGASDLSGFAVSGGGDFNNDGIDDFIIGASEPFENTAGQDGEAYVVFGTAGGFPANIALDSLTGTNGFSFLGFGAGSNAGTSVGNAGDVNGDGIPDVIIGAPGADPGGVNDAGEAYVIFGRNGAFPAQISAGSMVAADGFKIGGTPERYNLGNSVAGAGDVNGDGISDIIVGANGKSVPDPANPGGSNLSQGTSFVIFGRPLASPFPASVDVTALAVTEGFEIGTSETSVNLGLSVDGAGDINDDGIDDIVVGMPDSTTSSGQSKVYVVFGKSTGFASLIDVATMPVAEGFAIPAPRAGHIFGASVSGVGDVNGDGIDDLMASDGIDASGTTTVAAQSYLIFGSATAFPASLNISSLNGTTGVVIQGPAADHPSPMKVAGAGDVNGDGVMDVLIGLSASGVTPALPGGGYVVFGSDTGLTSPLNLSALNGNNGFLIEGRGVGGIAGRSVAAAGDVNGDGLADVIVGAPFESPGGNGAAGESYVVFGRGSTTTSGSGPISETLDLFPGDKVIYRVSATIAPTATVSTIVNATTAVGSGVSDGNPANDSDSATTLIANSDTTPPSITSIFARGTGWDPVFLDGIDGGGVGSGNGLGIELSPGHHIPNSGIDRLYLQFSEDIGSLSMSEVELLGSAGAYVIGTVSYDPLTFLATVPIVGVIGFDKLRFSVNDSVTDTAGNQLDGDGNSSPGGILDIRFDVIPGDINLDGEVFTTDLVGWQAAFNSLPGSSNYNPHADIDGDGEIFTTDLPIWQGNFNQNLVNLAEPAASSFVPPA